MNFKEEYNSLLTREKKAESYLMDERVPIEEREKWLAAYGTIVKQLGQMIYEYKKAGNEFTGDEQMNGFKEV
jgi:hypothetical protein